MHNIWNPWHGCKKISEGCENCYMYYLDRMRDKDGSYIYQTGSFYSPLKKDRKGNYKIKSGETISVCMTSDFFLEEADRWRNEAWEIMKIRSDVIFYLLTKRPQRVKNCLPENWGDGIIKIEMHFLPDVYVPCEVCGGKRYNRETLEVKYKGKSIYDVLNMTVEEAMKFFENVPSIYRKIATLYDVGLSYVRLGQPSTELSGGEAQRIKLATELSRRSTGKTIYILDEPTTGLHFADVHKLIEILRRLSEGGNTVVVIEHNLDVIKTADYIIDIGPEGGDKGGTVIAEGTPEEVAENPVSYTGQYVKKYLQQ